MRSRLPECAWLGCSNNMTKCCWKSHIIQPIKHDSGAAFCLCIFVCVCVDMEQSAGTGVPGIESKQHEQSKKQQDNSSVYLVIFPTSWCKCVHYCLLIGDSFLLFVVLCVLSVFRIISSQWWDAGMVICLELGADLHMTRLMPLPLTVSCSSKIQIGFTFLVPAHPGSSRKRAFKCVCVCV